MKYYTSTTEFNCGIDLHARPMYVCVMDRPGQKLVHTNVRDNDFNFFLKLVAPYKHSLTVCCECMFGWYRLADACHGPDARMEASVSHLRMSAPGRSMLEPEIKRGSLGCFMRVTPLTFGSS